MATTTVALPTNSIISSNGVDSQQSLVTESNKAIKKSRESDRRRRRRSNKKKNKKQNNNNNTETEDDSDNDNVKENTDLQQALEQVEIEYVIEKADLGEEYLGLKEVFEKFNVTEVAPETENEKKDEAVVAKKKADSDSDEEEQDMDAKDKSGVSNKKKKLQRRMNIAELKQICARPDVVEVWDATAADPKLLVFLKSYRNTVPVPRHWSQKRKFLQASAVTFTESGN